MSDPYIDPDEMQIYGPYAAERVRTVVVGLVPSFDAVLDELAVRILAATDTVKTPLEGTHDTDSMLRHQLPTKAAALAEGRAFLSRFSSHLNGYPPGVVDRRRYFTKDGTVHGVGQSAHAVALALSDIQLQLAKDDCPIHDRGAWLTQVTAAHDALVTPLQQSEGTRTDRRLLTPEVQAARATWLRTYRAARSVVEGVLRLAEKSEALSLIFLDASQHHAARKPPAGTPAPTPGDA